MAMKTSQQKEEEICEELLSKYEGRRVLGKGAYGQVYLVWSKEYQQEVVLKEVAWEGLTVPDGTDVEKVRSQIRREVRVMTDSMHDHVIGFVESFGAKAVHQKLFPDEKSADCEGKLKYGTGMLEDELTNAKTVLCIVMAYAQGGDLEKAIIKAKDTSTPIAEERIWKWLMQVTTALGYLHQNRVLHRDIKPANILLNEHDDAVIADLGIAKQLAEEQPMAQTQIGTPHYMCPELMDDREYDGKCDMWSLGVMLHELMTLEKPFDGPNVFHVFDKIKHVKPPRVPSASYSWALRTACKWLLQKDPKFRPDAFNFYSYCLLNFENHASRGSDGRPLVRDESIPWDMEELMNDDGKMDCYGEEYLGISVEERRVQKEEEERRLMESGTLTDHAMQQQLALDRNRLFKLGGSGGSGTGSPGPRKCMVVVGREHEEEDARHEAQAKATKKRDPTRTKAQCRPARPRTASSKASPSAPLPRKNPNGPQKRPSTTSEKARQLLGNEELYSLMRAHLQRLTDAESSKTTTKAQIDTDLLRRIDNGELESYADICQYSSLAARGAIRFDGTNPWKDYNAEPDTTGEEEELMKFIMDGEERVTWGALRVRRDLMAQFDLQWPAQPGPNAAN